MRTSFRARLIVGAAKAAHVVREQCQEMQRHIDYQMARARAAGRGTPGLATAVVPPSTR
jgi:hypothetical protein